MPPADPAAKPQSLSPVDMVMLWSCILVWLVTFLFGTLVDSAPYREQFAALAGGPAGVIGNGLLVLGTYTLTNVAILCLISSLLGALAARADLDTDRTPPPASDTSSPRNSALLRGFLVYLALIAGVLIFGDDPAAPTQKQYVRLAGFMSLFAFIISYRPTLFGSLLQRVGAVIEGKRSATDQSPVA